MIPWSDHDVTIRPVAGADLPAVAEIYGHYVTGSVATFDEIVPTAADWAEKLRVVEERRLPFVVAAAAGEVLGFAYASAWRPKPAYRYTVEDTIYLAPGGTGRGLGRRLLEAVLAGCRDAGVRSVIAVVADTGDPASMALHRRAGFREVGRLARVGRKHGRWVDTVLLQLDLAPA
ncbi:N-acetyltransferase family protein [Actinoplanes sp. NPDC049548]|uniref:GNAT family N-acetyltransferase n=1 Tax=Actinoplanes sp. NPDC049548 TaxID=3155152 RepID=UPI0034300276